VVKFFLPKRRKTQFVLRRLQVLEVPESRDGAGIPAGHVQWLPRNPQQRGRGVRVGREREALLHQGRVLLEVRPQHQALREVGLG